MQSASKNTSIRPDLPLLLICALCLWASSAGAYVGLKVCALDSLRLISFISAVLCVLSLVAFVYLYKSKLNSTSSKTLLFISFLFLGTSLGSLSSLQYFYDCNSIPKGDYECKITLQSDISSSEFGSSATAEIELPEGKSYLVKAIFSEGQDGLYEGQDGLYEGQDGLYTGAKLEANVKITSLSESSRERSYLSGIVAQVKIDSFNTLKIPAPLSWIYDLRANAIELLQKEGGQTGPLLQALVC